MRPHESRPHYFYRLYDVGGRLLYVGSTSDLKGRRSGHQGLMPWWPLVDSWRITGPMDILSARRMEREVIAAESPRHNRDLNVSPPSLSPAETALAVAWQQLRATLYNGRPMSGRGAESARLRMKVDRLLRQVEREAVA